jgi:hypothetical protein
MDIPAEVQKCVVFVGCRRPGGKESLIGSAFFVAKLARGAHPITFRYVVTAAHVIEAIRDKLGLDTVLLRVNRKSGDAQWIETRLQDWYFHPDQAVDVAVMPIQSLIGFDHNLFPLHLFLNADTVRDEKVGAGNEVFLVGLFYRHFGGRNNIPIVRVGNVAAMPGEKVNTCRGPTDAYLIECRSIGGLSGCPVFLPLGTTRSISGLAIGQMARYFLLGLMHGHFDVREALTDESIAAQDGSPPKSVNMGIAVVVPIEKVLDTLNQDKILDLETRKKGSIQTSTGE